MFESFRSFSDYVQEYDLERAEGVPSTYSSARPEPDQSPACWHHSSMISSLVALGPGHGRKHRH